MNWAKTMVTYAQCTRRINSDRGKIYLDKSIHFWTRHTDFCSIADNSICNNNFSSNLLLSKESASRTTFQQSLMFKENTSNVW